ncbi:MAG: hypothetical protein V4621_07580 [Pseudomonadota bacterium]
MKPIEAGWKEYQSAVVCKQEVTKSEMGLAKISYYAGAISLYSLVMTKAKDAEFGTGDGEDLLKEIEKEQLEFTVDVLLNAIKHRESTKEGS